MNRYYLIRARGHHYMLSNTSAAILYAVVKRKELSYDELASITGAPLNLLYVYAGRLEKAKLLKRKKVLSGKPKRVRTVIVRTAAIKFCDVRVIR